ncbi:MAG: hypothetical protein NZ738_03055, partial [Oceanospirillaceae bacterium]|nr:hypothetical protein [Oceanospirillaceae bacterium]
TIDLGTSSVEFKDAYFDGTVTSDAFAGPLTGNVTGDASGSSGSCTGNAATSTLATSITVSANNTADETVYPLFVDGATGSQGAETDTGLTYNPSSGLLTSTLFAGDITGDVTGNADTVTNGVYTTSKINVLAATTSSELAGVISDETGSGALVFATSPTLVTPALGTPSALVATNASGTAASLTAGTATVATTVTITDNESTNENNAIIFTAGGDLDGGNLGLESDGDLHYNPSTGTVTATVFVGALTGNASGTAATVTGGTQASITSAANLVTIGTIGTGVWQGTAIDGAYIDIEGTEIKSTGPEAATKYLRADGDGTCSWQTVSGGSASNSFETIAVTGQDSVVAESATDTLNLVEGSNVTITTVAATDSITIAAADTNTTYSAGDGLDLSTTTFSVDLKANGGLVIESTEVAVDLGASSITGTLAVGDGGTGLTSISTLLNSNVTPTSLSLLIGTNTQAYDAQLDTLAALTANQVGGLVDLATLEAPASDGQFIVATGAGVFAYESGSTARTSIGLGSVENTALSTWAGTTNITTLGTITSGTWTGTAIGASYVSTLNQDTSGTAAIATAVTVSANNATDETVYPVFVDGATGTQGAETDTGLTYNPSSGLLTSTAFAGALTGNVTGNADTVTNG